MHGHPDLKTNMPVDWLDHECVKSIGVSQAPPPLPLHTYFLCYHIVPPVLSLTCTKVGTSLSFKTIFHLAFPITALKQR